MCVIRSVMESTGARIRKHFFLRFSVSVALALRARHSREEERLSVSRRAERADVASSIRCVCLRVMCFFKKINFLTLN